MSGKNNSRTNKGFLGKIVSPFAKADNKQQQQQQQQIQQQQQQQQGDPNEVLMGYLKDQGLFTGIDVKAFTEAVREGDVEKATEIFQASMMNTAKISITATKKLIDANSSALSEQLNDRTTASQKYAMAEQAMHTNAPFTKDAVYQDMAKMTLQGYLDQGQTPEQAAKSTVDYFRAVAIAQGAKLPQEGNQRPGQRDFKHTTNNDNSHSDDTLDPESIDFIDVFTGGAQTENDVFEKKPDTSAQQQQNDVDDDPGDDDASTASAA